MTNKIIAILTACLILLSCTPVFANTFEGDATVSEIKEAEENILAYANGILSSEGMNTITKSDLDYNIIYQVYPGMSKVFENTAINNEIMYNCISNERYSYYIPIYDGNRTALITVSKRAELDEETKLTLTEEEIENYETTVGKWDASSVSISQGEINYKAEINKALIDNNIENANVYLLGAICHNISLAAVICTDNPKDTRIKVLKQFESQTNSDGGSTLDKDILYSYDEIKAIVDKDKESNNSGISGAGISAQVPPTQVSNDSKIIIISVAAGVAVLAIAVAAFCIVKKKKKENVQ